MKFNDYEYEIILGNGTIIRREYILPDWFTKEEVDMLVNGYITEDSEVLKYGLVSYRRIMY